MLTSYYIKDSISLPPQTIPLYDGVYKDHDVFIYNNLTKQHDTVLLWNVEQQ